ncbi:MAG TPA: hypothetical protein VF284_07480 [Rhodanobacteraceae bacterium]
MKHLSLCVTVLLLGGVPLTAAALDYGPNAPLLAAETASPQLPGAQVHAVAHGEMPQPEAMTADDGNDAGGNPSTQHLAPSSSAHPGASRHVPGPAASNKPHGSVAHPTPVPHTASWQSLLPGSIQ